MSCNPFTLTVVFHGLIAFVVPALSRPGYVPEVWAVMANATDLRTVPAPFLDPNQARRHILQPDNPLCKISDEDDFLHPHRAAIRYKNKNISAEVGDSVGLWILDGYDLRLSFTPTPGEVELVGGRQPGSSVPSDDLQRADFSWVPRVKDVSRNLGKINKDIISPITDQRLRERIAGRIKLNGGRLSTGSVSGDTDASGKFVPRLFEFKPKIVGLDLRQALADTVVYSLTINACDISFRGLPFGDDVNMRTLTLAPSKGESEVIVEIVNVREDFLIPHEELSKHEDSHGGENFLWFYKLSSDNLGPFPIPSQTLSVNGKPYCPMAVFEP
jgi:hypothetical protein